MPDLLSLAQWADDFINHGAVPTFANEVAIDAAMAIVEDLAMHTPADVGDAESNWQVTLDQSAITLRNAYVPSPKGRLVRGVWTHAVPPDATILANAPSVIAAASQALAGKKPGQVIYITNNAPYIDELDQGSSTQQPSGFVARAQIVGENSIAHTQRKIKP